MSPHDMARAAALARLVLGTGWTVAPGLVGRAWLGPKAGQTSARALGRAVGARDLGLGAGLLLALGGDAPPRRWLQASAGASVVDLLTTLALRDEIAPASRTAAVVLAAASAGVNLYAASALVEQGAA